MWARIPALILVAAFATGAFALGAAEAAKLIQSHDNVPERLDGPEDDGEFFDIDEPLPEKDGEFFDIDEDSQGSSSADPGALLPWLRTDIAESARAVVAKPRTRTYRTANVDATLQPGEPTSGGLMTRTIWATAPAFAGSSKRSHNKLVKVTGVTTPAYPAGASPICIWDST